MQNTLTSTTSVSPVPWRLSPQLPVFPPSPKTPTSFSVPIFRIFPVGCHAQHQFCQREVANGSTDTKACICAHDIVCSSAPVCGGVRGSAASKKGQQRISRAMAALMFNLIQLLRKLIGKVRLEVFVEWCKHTVECYRELQGTDSEVSEQSEAEIIEYEGSDVHDAGVLESKVKMNNIVAGNELGST